jgi:cold shock CspA family protein
MDKRKGYIKWYSTKKHFGFLFDRDDNREVFFHVNDCRDFIPRENIVVEFEYGMDYNGRTKAVHIERVGGENGHTKNNKLETRVEAY